MGTRTPIRSAPPGPCPTLGPSLDHHARRAALRGHRRRHPRRSRRRGRLRAGRPSWPADRADLAAQVVTLVNAHRAQLGLVALVVSPTLTATAEWKARNMAAYGYLDHDDPAPDARTADERLAACGYQSTEWGENIASGFATAQAVVDALAGLPRAPREHRAPGVPRHRRRRRRDRRPYWAQSFGAMVDAGSVVPAPVACPRRPRPRPPPRHPARRLRPSRRTTRPRSPPLRVTCAQRGRGVACRVLGRRGTMVRIALMRSGQTFARARMRTAAGTVRVRLHTDAPPARRPLCPRRPHRPGGRRARAAHEPRPAVGREASAGSLPRPCSRSRTTSRPIARRSSRSC